MNRWIRRYEIEPNGRSEPFLFSFTVAHPKAVVERVETRHTASRDVGVLWVRDRGDPEEVGAVPVTRYVVCVPIFAKARQAAILDECGAFLGAFQDRHVRWFVFAYVNAKTEEPSKPAPEKAAHSAGTRPPQPQRPASSASGLPRGNPTTPGAKKNP